MHLFILSPGEWGGHGFWSLSSSVEVIHFYMKWFISPREGNLILCEQQIIAPEANPQPITNHFKITMTTENAFNILLITEAENEILGSGFIDENKIMWNFPSGKELYGFETYTLLENGQYEIHAEYNVDQPIKTIIDAVIWQQK